MNLAQLLIDSADRRPDHPAVIFGDQQATYRELDRRTDALAWGLRERGLGPGDIVVLMMPNSIDWITVYYALAKLGAVVLPVNFLYRTEELTHIFRDSGARAFMGRPDHLAYAGPLVLDDPQFHLRLTTGQEVPEGFESLDDLFLDRGPFSCIWGPRQRHLCRHLYQRHHRPGQRGPADPFQPGLQCPDRGGYAIHRTP